ncbi:MAG: hypothetical protein M0Z72_03515 [Deltaproteobacteria bacterium]|nr:hypothetical protein [Deltaproteobacteria bacterium]
MGARTKNAEDITLIIAIYIKYKKTGLKIYSFEKNSITIRVKIENKKNKR